MGKKNIIIIIIGVAVAVIGFLSVFFILKMKKPENIKVGMTREKAMSILDKGKYKRKYTKSEIDDGTSIQIKEVSLENINGKVIIVIDNSSNRVDHVTFFSDNKYTGEKDRVEILYNYLVETYGDMSYENEKEEGRYKYWVTDDMEILFAAYGNPIITWMSHEE